MTPHCPLSNEMKADTAAARQPPPVRPASHTSLIIFGRIATMRRRLAQASPTRLTLDSARLLKSLLFLEFARVRGISPRYKDDCAIEDASIWRGRERGGEG